MRILKIALFALVVFSFNTSCYKDKDDDIIINDNINEINDFVYKAMNAVYLYKSKIPNLANNRFTSKEAYTSYLNSYAKPEDLFESLIYQRETVDRFSLIAADGVELLNQLDGIYKSDGLEIILYKESNANSNLIGFVKLVLNNSPASEKGVKRGQIFYGVNGQQLTIENYRDLLYQETYTLNFAKFNPTNQEIERTLESVNLTKVVYNENPVYMNKTFTMHGKNIGYLLYNSFTADHDNDLNNAFGELKANNVQDLILDLRYNGGGSVNSAVLLGSMITGQFKGQVFSKLVYNEELQKANHDYLFTDKLSKNGPALNSLNLQKLYVLTTSSTASASELIINSLKEYIDVVQIGENTTGKTQASMPIFDSEDLSSNNINPRHTYVLLPLIANSVDKNGGQVPSNGITPQFELEENPLNYGTIGNNFTEPLLVKAFDIISGATSRPSTSPLRILEPTDIKVNNKLLDGIMFVD